MERRRFLEASGLVAAGLAGCLAPSAAGVGHECPGTAPPPASGLPAPRRAATGPVDLPVSKDDLARGALRDDIPAITEPRFGPDWCEVDASLSAGDLVIGVTRGGRVRAYPLATLATYEVVNDDVGGPLLVTYCPLCASAVTAVREVRGQPTVFGVSGLLYRSNLVLYDQLTGSLWSQVLARAIQGPETGSTLDLVPSTLATWEDWRGTHPTTEVLLPPPVSGTISSVPEGMPAGVHGHVGVQEVGLDFDDDRLPRTALVVGIATETAAKAYPRDRVAAAGVVNDCVGGFPVVVGGSRLPQAYDRRVDGDVLRFERAGPDRLRGGGSTWSVASGRALSGRHEGASLYRAPVTTMYWFAWLDFHPETTVYGG